jgi:Lhr-like helicase
LRGLAIKVGQNALNASPTGSGKTLASCFLGFIDCLARQGLGDGLKDETEIVYLDALKGLSNNILRNLLQNASELRVANAGGTLHGWQSPSAFHIASRRVRLMKRLNGASVI